LGYCIKIIAEGGKKEVRFGKRMEKEREVLGIVY